MATQSKKITGIQILTRDMADRRPPRDVWNEIFTNFSKSNPNQKFSFMPHSFDVINNPGHTKKKKILESIIAIPI